MTSQHEDVNLDEIYAFALDLSKNAGQILLDAAAQRTAPGATLQKTSEKDSSVDIVTSTDIGSSFLQRPQSHSTLLPLTQFQKSSNSSRTP